MSYHTTIIIPTMQDVHDWALAQNNKDYANAVNRASDHFDHLPLPQIPADLTVIKRVMPLHGFDPRLAKSEKAYKARRRKIIAAVKGATGELTEAIERRKRADHWADLLDILLPHAINKDGNDAPQILVPIRKLADLGRQHQTPPDKVSQEWLKSLRGNLDSNHWHALQRALKNLNGFREVDGVKDLLPQAPFPPAQTQRFQVTPGVPEVIAQEINQWVDIATQTNFDPVENRYEDSCSQSDIAYKRAALRKFVSALHFTENHCLDTSEGLQGLLTPENAILAVRYWTSNQTGEGIISARTANDYMKSIYVVLARNGHDPSHIKCQLGQNRFLKQGKDCDSEMSSSARQFCETLLGSTTLIVKFLSMHSQMRNQAQEILNLGVSENRALTDIERIKVRQIGTIAAFCAIETRGAPIRVMNALSFRIRGKGHDFHLPTKMTGHIVFQLPKSKVKNKKAIWAPIKRNNLNGLEVIEWYLEHIRPMFPNADESEYLFPSVVDSVGLTYRTFLTWFKRHTRAYGLPMTPHKFRHGLASLLLQRNPGRWDLLERLLDDSPNTVRKNYAWVNEREKRVEVQKYILDLSETAR
jgi:hypothetical protein